MNDVVPAEAIESLILILRGEKVIIDADLARLYGVKTKRLNEQIRRNIERFPDDFMFQLNEDERQELVANCGRFKNLRHSSAPPLAFTEHGALMTANILNSHTAIGVSVQVVRAFVKLRKTANEMRRFADKLQELEVRADKTDENVTAIFEAIRQLMAPPDQPKRKIGFNAKR